MASLAACDNDDDTTVFNKSASSTAAAGGNGGSATVGSGGATGGSGGVPNGGAGGTGGSAPSGASCADPIALSAGWYASDFDSTGATDDYSVYECGGTQTASGEDMVFTVDVPDDSYLVVAQNPAFASALALFLACDPTDTASCIDYHTGGSGRDSLTHLNTAGMTETYYLFSDAVATNTAGPLDELGVGIYDPTAGGEVCNTAIALDSMAVRATGGLSTVHGAMGYTADYDPADALGCIGLINSNTAGRDVVFVVPVNTGETITASVTSLRGDVNAIYLLTGDCGDPVNQCEDGDATGAAVTYTSTVNNTNVFIVVDAASAGTSASGFILDVAVST